MQTAMTERQLSIKSSWLGDVILPKVMVGSFEESYVLPLLTESILEE